MATWIEPDGTIRVTLPKLFQLRELVRKALVSSDDRLDAIVEDMARVLEIPQEEWYSDREP